MDLYQKIVTEKGRVSYKPYFPQAPKKEDFTDEELITLAATIGMVILIELRNLLPEHKRNARHILKVEEAIADLVRGTGAPLPKELSEHWLDCWNRTMLEIQTSGVAALKEEVPA